MEHEIANMKQEDIPCSLEEAFQRIFAEVPIPVKQLVSLESALGCILAEDVVSDLNMPPFDKSAMDGYAVLAQDTEKVPVVLEVIEELPAGKFPTLPIRSGQASKIMTGAALPSGADAVIMVEKTEVVAPNKVRILSAVREGQNVCFLGEDLREGEVVLKKGALLRPQEIGVLAAVGKKIVPIYTKPRVAMLVTGDELVEVHEKPQKGQIRNSNGYSVSAQVRAMGLEYVNLGIVRDVKEEIRRKIRQGLECDVLILSGGVSVGEYDFVVEALEAEGVQTILHRVSIKPGRPFYFGKKGAKRVFALPGNPVATFVIFEVFVRPFLGLMQGNKVAGRARFKARMSTSFVKSSDRLQFLPGKLTVSSEEAQVELLPWHGSADIFALTRANCFIIVPANTTVAKGDMVEVMLLEPYNE